MKKFTSILFAAAALSLNAMAQETVVTYSFDDASSPALEDAQNIHLDYTHTSVISNSVFLNIWAENNTTKPTTIALTENDLTEKGQWTLEFDWAGYGGCNTKAGNTTLKAGDVTIFNIYDKADWNNTFDIQYSGQTTAIPVYPCNKSNRISAATGDALNTATNWHHFTVVGNAAGVALTIQTYAADGTLGEKVLDNVTVYPEYVSPTAILAHAGSCGAVAIDELSLYTEDVQITTANYTVKFVTADGTEVKASETREGIVGETVSLLGTDKEFWIEDTKYLYVSDNTADVVVESDGSTVIIVTVRPAEFWGYILTTNFGDVISLGETLENTSVTVAYPRYINVLGDLIKSDANNKEYHVTFTVTHDGYEAVRNYQETDISNVVYCSEAEDIPGLQENTYGNVYVRASNALTAVATENTVITELEAGQYKVVAGVFSSAKTPDYIIKIGICDSIWEAPVKAVNASEVAIENVNVAGGEVVLYAEGMGNNNALDYIYIQKTGEYVAPEGDPTAIKNVNVETSDVMYNLAGQRVSKANGIVVVNGKKVVK